MIPAFDRLLNYPLDRMVKGVVRFVSFDKENLWPNKVIVRENDVMFEGADIMAQLLSGHSEFAVSTMYLEFKNLAAPGDVIVPPVFDRTGGVDYYNGLIGSPDIDFLRVPLLIGPTLSSSGSSYAGNQVTFYAQSEGTTGFHGKTFDASANSAVFGAALVSTPSPSDQSQDRVWARLYTGIDKVLKQTGYEIGVTWMARFN